MSRTTHFLLKGMHRIGITSFAYFPLTSATSDAPDLIKKAAESVDVLKKGGKLEPGQADIWTRKFKPLKDDTLPDLEIIAFPVTKYGRVIYDGYCTGGQEELLSVDIYSAT
ncbi:hypothetical protein B0H17DRAFT_1140764 [Mycena rosella]|uniref:Uncharacterized protein n=1 Tax=Mycena rosella TaxID=1033263 RepID=A0AAD7D2K6_MYCRO|nr:hypothetical protein B0H17DRAFT_1140764 [Mycena rosella]